MEVLQKLSLLFCLPFITSLIEEQLWLKFMVAPGNCLDANEACLVIVSPLMSKRFFGMLVSLLILSCF